MKKTSLLLLIILPIFFSCVDKDKKAKKLIQKDLFESIYDYSSYKPIKTEKVDSAFSSPLTDSVILLNAAELIQLDEKREGYIEKLKEATDDIKLWTESFGYYGKGMFYKAKKSGDENLELLNKNLHESDSLEGVLMKQISSFTPIFIGYKTVHNFRAKSRGGIYGIYTIEYIFDKKIDKIIRKENLTPNDFEDDVTPRQKVEMLMR